MKYPLHVNLLSKDLQDKVEAMREYGLNTSALVRNFLLEFKLPSEKNREVA